MGLKKYHAKRDFKITREPSGKKIKKRTRKKVKSHTFVIQEHHARRLHWDFRLEFDGVLKSWAVPKGPSLDPSDKRLAVEVEDHPISYGSFEGEIPKGEYGAGQVKLWDRGTWEPPKNTRESLKKGHLDFVLHGEKLNGAWTLIRLKKTERVKNNWLLFKRKDEFSINPKAKKNRKLPSFIKPQLAQLVDRVPVGAEWFYEIKFDGYRTFCRIDKGKINFLTRTGRDWTDVYENIKTFAQKIDVETALIDGDAPAIKNDHPIENIKISHPGRIVFKKTKTIKMDVVNYYNTISGLILPFLKDRPLSLLRCQTDSLGDCYFQKHSEGRNLLGITDKPVRYRDKHDTAISVNSKTELIKIIQAGTVEIHSWNASFSHITTPDQIVFDLDPESTAEWSIVIETAFLIKEMLEALGLMSFVKVTGGKGIHIHVPIVPSYSWDEIKSFAKILMTILENQMPTRYTTNMSKTVRKRKIFLDYLRNGYGATAVVPYSLRARREPSVALPISWRELRTIQAADEFIFPDVLKLIKHRRDPWRDYWNIKQKIKTLEGLTSKGWAA